MNDDLISRAALLEWLCEGCNGAKKVGCGSPCCDYDLIVQAPAVDAEPVRHGRWVHGMQCSECKQVDLARPNYCCNCGAKMDGGEKNVNADGLRRE